MLPVITIAAILTKVNATVEWLIHIVVPPTNIANEAGAGSQLWIRRSREKSHARVVKLPTAGADATMTTRKKVEAPAVEAVVDSQRWILRNREKLPARAAKLLMAVADGTMMKKKAVGLAMDAAIAVETMKKVILRNVVGPHGAALLSNMPERAVKVIKMTKTLRYPQRHGCFWDFSFAF